MKRLFAILIILVAIGVGVWFLNTKNSSTKVPSDTVLQTGIRVNPLPANDEGPITQPKLAIDLYPLYADAIWNKTTIEKSVIGTTTYSGASMTSAVIDANMDPGKVFTPFLKYYDDLLTSRGWHIAHELAAGGHTGGQTGYKNGPGVILVGFHIEYKTIPKDAPSECPCTVTFSLFSSGATD